MRILPLGPPETFYFVFCSTFYSMVLSVFSEIMGHSYVNTNRHRKENASLQIFLNESEAPRKKNLFMLISEAPRKTNLFMLI
jgi:hypothetical protein